MLNVVWFKRDLRVTDHAPLLKAVAEGLVLPLYIVEPGYWEQPTTSARQWRFVARSLAALRTQLAVLGAPLVVRTGEALDVLEAVREQSKDLVLWSHQETADAFCRARDEVVRNWAGEHDIPWHELAQPGVFPGPATRKDWMERWLSDVEAEPLPAPEQMIAHGLTPGKIVSERILYLDDDPCMDLAAGPAVARRLMRNYFETGREIGSDNEPDPEMLDGEPRLSAHVSLGTLSLREIHHAARHEHSSKSLVPLPAILSRLRYRTDLLQRFLDQPEIEQQPMHPAFEALEPARGDDLLRSFEEGRTGYPMVDAAMRALNAAGWIDLEMRRLCLSVATWRMDIDWRASGSAIARGLTNYEPGVHWVLTQMCAGLTGFDDLDPLDPVSTAERLDPDGSFVRRWVPELADVPHEKLAAPWEMTVAEQAASRCVIGQDYPAPPDGAEMLLAEKLARRAGIMATPEFAATAQALRRRHLAEAPRDDGVAVALAAGRAG